MSRLPLFLVVLFGTFVWMAALAGPCPAETMVFLRDGALWRADTRGMQAQELAKYKNPREVALSPDGSLAAVIAGRQEQTGLGFVFLTPTGGGPTRQLYIQGVKGVSSPSFSPDGSSLLLVTAQDVRQDHQDNMTLATMTVSRVSLSGQVLNNILASKDAFLDAGYLFSSPVFSSNGQFIAVQQSGSDVSGGFYVLDQEGEEVFSYPQDPQDYRPYWSPQFLPDGETILCWSPRLSASGQNEISLVRMSDGRRTVIAQGSRPALVHGGSAMVYERCGSLWNATSCGIWFQELKAGAKATRILTNAHAPAGVYPLR